MICKSITFLPTYEIYELQSKPMKQDLCNRNLTTVVAFDFSLLGFEAHPLGKMVQIYPWYYTLR